MAKYEELQTTEHERFSKHMEEHLEVKKERDVAVEAMSKMRVETEEKKMELEKKKFARDDEKQKLIHKIRRMEREVEELNKTTEEVCKSKDA